MFRSLSLKAKILALPLVAAVGFVATLAIVVSFGIRAQHEQTRIATGHQPALMATQQLAITLDGYQRALRDAVGASDEAAIAAADSIATAFGQTLDTLLATGVADSAAIDSIRTGFGAYAEGAKVTSLALITGDLGVDIMTGSTTMREQYGALSAQLGERLASRKAAIEAAFASASGMQRRAMLASVGVLIFALVALGFIAIRTQRDVVGSVSRLSDVASGIAAGRIDQTIDVTGTDEIGRLADSFRGTLSYIGEIAHAADRLAAGDLSVKVAPRSGDDVLARNMNRAVESLQAVITAAADISAAAAAGDLAKRHDVTRYQGAYRDVLEGSNQMLDALAEPVEEALSVLERIAQRDLTARMQGNYQGDHARIRNAVNSATAEIGSAFASLTTAVAQVNAASAEIGSGSQDLASGASDQAGSIDQVSNRLKVVDDRTKANAADAHEARATMEKARTDTVTGVERMHSLADAMAEIKKSADSTARIVKTIDEIAFQTNLLALNAAVEAARAGDAGKGFAVVADEVRSLAIRAADAARNTAALIEESVQKADAGVSLNESVRRRLEEIRTGVEKASTMMANIADGAREQEQELAEVTSAMSQIASLTQRTAANAEESASAAAELSAQAGEMHALASQFKVDGSTKRSAPRSPAAHHAAAPVEDDLFPVKSTPAAKPSATKGGVASTTKSAVKTTSKATSKVPSKVPPKLTPGPSAAPSTKTPKVVAAAAAPAPKAIAKANGHTGNATNGSNGSNGHLTIDPSELIPFDDDDTVLSDF